MPRASGGFPKKIASPGLVDLHFHGAFGIDLMRASPAEMDRLARRLWRSGIAAFCPTTLSAPPRELRAAVERIGAWIESRRAAPDPEGARPLGIHLEGPFVHPEACGAHPPSALRDLGKRELEDLWKASQGALKILTVAPERLDPALARWLAGWARRHGVVLSLGHSRATEAQALAAFRNGFTGVTHAWNALPFHQRSPGPLGAALGNPDIHVEVIIDQIHVAPTVIRWTLELHPHVCFVSDAVPAAGTASGKGPGPWCSFGSLKIRQHEGACRNAGGHLAGGGRILSDSYRRWLAAEAKATGIAPARLLRATLGCVTTGPLRALGLSARALADRRVFWQITAKGKVSALAPKPRARR